MWSRICTTWPEKPHCGNCGVPFMNSTTSFDFTSWSMNCSMLIFASFCGTAFRLASALNPTLSYMYPKPLCIQSKLGGSWYAPHRPSKGRTTPPQPSSWPRSRAREAFIPDRSPYLGQAIRGEPGCHSNVLTPNGDYRDETSIRCGRAGRPLPVIILRFRWPRRGFGGSVPHGSKRDRVPRRSPDGRGSADPVDAGCEPGEMAPRPYHLVLRAIPARRTLQGLHALSSGLCLPVQFLLRQRRSTARPSPARPSDPSRRRRNYRLPPACRRRRGEILPGRR